MTKLTIIIINKIKSQHATTIEKSIYRRQQMMFCAENAGI